MDKEQSIETLRLEECDWFITENAAVNENILRIEALEKVADTIDFKGFRRYSDGVLYQLAEKLNECNHGRIKCNSIACKKCNRLFQIERVNNIVKAIGEDEKSVPDIEYCVITIIQYSRSVDAYDFVNYDIPKDKDRIRQILSRSHIKGPVIGCFELDFHKTAQKWLTHYHLLVRLTGNEDTINLLRYKIKNLHPKHIKKNRVSRPFLVQEFNNPFEQLSYIHKLSCFEVRDYQSLFGKQLTKKFRLEEMLFCESLCWLDEKDRRTLPFQWHAREWLKQSKD